MSNVIAQSSNEIQSSHWEICVLDFLIRGENSLALGHYELHLTFGF